MWSTQYRRGQYWAHQFRARPSGSQRRTRSQVPHAHSGRATPIRRPPIRARRAAALRRRVTSPAAPLHLGASLVALPLDDPQEVGDTLHALHLCAGSPSGEPRAAPQARQGGPAAKAQRARPGQAAYLREVGERRRLRDHRGRRHPLEGVHRGGGSAEAEEGGVGFGEGLQRTRPPELLGCFSGGGRGHSLHWLTSVPNWRPLHS